MLLFQMSSDIEDLFDQSEEAEKKTLERQFDNYASNFFQSGFREAMMDDEANEKELQVAFDSGYKIGHEIASQFGTLQYTTKLIEGLYEDKRLKPPEDESLLQALKDFNCRMERLAKDLSELMNSAQSVDQVNQKFNELVQMDNLKAEVREILQNLSCPTNVAQCIFTD